MPGFLEAEPSDEATCQPAGAAATRRERSVCLPIRLFQAAGMTPERLIALVGEVTAFRDAVTSFTAGA